MGNKNEIIIVGGGIAGLYAANLLLEKGKSVLILEARARLGGRIYTVENPFSQMTELGAEFVHGKSKLTKQLLTEAGAEIYEKPGKIYRAKNGMMEEMSDFIEDQKKFMRELKHLKQDMSLADFLHENFTEEEDEEMKETVVNAAQGFDAADIERLSAFSVKEEWGGGGMEKPFVIKEGFGKAVDYLLDEIRKKGGCIWTDTIVSEIEWSKGLVRVKTANENYFEAGQLLITVPLGILRLKHEAEGSLRFFPDIPQKRQAAEKMGYGPVIKVNIEFVNAFWQEDEFAEIALQLKDLGFLSNETEFPMWWTRNPSDPFLTGWVGGTAAKRLQHLNDDVLKETALNSLSELFECGIDFLRAQLKNIRVSNWGGDEFSLGAYSYETLESEEARKILQEPLDHTLFFAGEALGEEMGTVESALSSARQSVRQIIA